MSSSNVVEQNEQHEDHEAVETSKHKHRFHVPEEAVRLSIMVPIFMLLGFYLYEVIDKEWKIFAITYCLWCAMTMVLASSNEMGGVIKDGLRRVGGALITGILSTGVVWLFKNEHILEHNTYIHSDAVIVAIAGIVVMFFAQVFAAVTNYRKTAVIVSQLFIKCCFAGRISGYYFIWSIVLGTVTGVILISLASVLIMPRSNSYKAMMNMKVALEKLTSLSTIIMAELLPENVNEEEKQEVISILSMEDPEIMGVVELTQQIRKEDNTLRSCEDMMFDIYKLLDQMKANLRLSKNEVCLQTRHTKAGARWFLLPGMKFFKCLCSNPLPYEHLDYVQVNIRRVARHLWSVLLSIDHMWDETVTEVIKQRYPQQVLPKICALMTEALSDISKAFPGEEYVTQKHLIPLELEVELMLQISNKWRTRATIQDSKDHLTEQGRKRALKRAAARTAATDSDSKRTSLSLNAVYNGLESPKSLNRYRSKAAGKSKGYQPPLTPMDKVVEEPKMAPQETIPEETPSSIGNSAGENSLDADLQVALLKGEEQLSDGGIFKKMGKLMSVGPRKKIDVEVTTDVREKRRERIIKDTVSEEGTYSPRESSSSLHLHSSSKFQRIQSVDPNSSVVASVELVDESKALSFPVTDEGHTQEARWYSFQFSIDELLDALIALHTAVNDLLENYLPQLDLSDKLMERYQLKN